LFLAMGHSTCVRQVLGVAHAVFIHTVRKCTSRLALVYTHTHFTHSNHSHFSEVTMEMANTTGQKRKRNISEPVDTTPAGQSDPEVETKRYSRGLPNYTNGYCYRNAVLQCLISFPEFDQFCKDRHQDCEVGRWQCLPCALQYLTSVYWEEYDDDDALELAAKDFHRVLEATVPDDDPMAKVFNSDKGGHPAKFLGYLLKLFKPLESVEGPSTTKSLFNIKQDVTWICEDCGRSFFHHENGDETGHFQLPAIVAPYVWEESLANYFRNEYYRTGVRSVPDCTPFWNKLSMIEPRTMIRKHSRPGSVKHGRYTVEKEITEAPEMLIVEFPQSIKDHEGKTGIEAHEGKTSIDGHDGTRFVEHLDIGYTKDGKRLLYRLQAIVAGSDELYHVISAVRQPDGTQFRTINDLEVSQSWPGIGNIMELLRPKAHVNFTHKKGVFPFYINLLFYRKVSD